jgi:hypothetical protein
MDKAPLVMDEIEAGKALVERLNDHFSVIAACWLREGEGGERYLYVALDGLTVPKADLAYGEVIRIAGEMKDHYIDPFRVKIIGPTDPIAKAVTALYRRFPGRTPPTRLNEPIFGVGDVEEMYIYPPPKKP